MIILNIHGYDGSARNTAYRILDELYPGNVVSPQIDYDNMPPDAVVSILSRLIKSENIGVVVGTSLGGFFACCAGGQYEVPIILVNPCLQPFLTLKQISGVYDEWRYGRESFRLHTEHIGNLDRRYISTIIGKSDELIDHQRVTAYFTKNERWYEVEGGHQLERTDELVSAFREIIDWYEQSI